MPILKTREGLYASNRKLIRRSSTVEAPVVPVFEQATSVSLFNTTLVAGVVEKIDGSTLERNDGFLSADTYRTNQDFVARVTIQAEDAISGNNDFSFGLVDSDRATPSYGNYNFCGVGAFNGRVNTRYYDGGNTNDSVNAILVSPGDVIEFYYYAATFTYDIHVNGATRLTAPQVITQIANNLPIPEEVRFQFALQGDARFLVEIKHPDQNTAQVHPVASLSVPQPASGLQVNANASASSGRFGATISSYTFDMGDGTVVTQAGGTYQHTYSSEGTYWVQVIVRDSNGIVAKDVQVVTLTSISLNTEWNTMFNNIYTYATVTSGGFSEAFADGRTAQAILDVLQSDGSFSDNAFSSFALQEDHIESCIRLALDYDTTPGTPVTPDDVYTATLYWLNNQTIDTDLSASWSRNFRVQRDLAHVCIHMKAHVMANASGGNLAEQFRDAVILYLPLFFKNFQRYSADNVTGSNWSSRWRAYSMIVNFLEDTTRMNIFLRETFRSFELGQGVGLQRTEFAFEYWVGPVIDLSYTNHNTQGGMMVWGNYGSVAFDEISWILTFIKGTVWRLSTDFASIFHLVASVGLKYMWYNLHGSSGTQARWFRHSKGRNMLQRIVTAESLNVQFARMRDLGTQSGFTQSQLDDFEEIRDKAASDNEGTTTVGDRYYFSQFIYVRQNVTSTIPASEQFVFMYMASGKYADSIEQGIGFQLRNYDYGYGTFEYLKDPEGGEDALLPATNHELVPGGTSPVTDYVGKTTTAGTGRTSSTNTFAGGAWNGAQNAVVGMQKARKHSGDLITGNKTFFAFQNVLAFMGSELADNRNRDYFTTIISEGIITDVVHDLNGSDETFTLDSMASGSTELPGVDIAITQARYFHINNTGYIIVPRSGETVNLKLWIEVRAGNWNELDSSQGTFPVSGPVVDFAVNHGRNFTGGEYLFFLIPNATPVETATFASTLPFTIASWDANLHSIYLNEDDALGHCQYEDTGTSSWGVGQTFTLNKKGVAVLVGNGANFDGHLADAQHQDPDRAVGTITATYNGSSQAVALSTDLLNLEDPAGASKSFIFSKS